MIGKTVRFDNGFSLRLAAAGRRFLGIGEVRFGRTRLRSPALPWTLYTESETGVRFEDFELRGVERATDGAATLVLAASGRWLPRLQEADAMGDARIRTRRAAPASATFRWTFRPITETIAGNAWTGLAMRIEIDCPGHPVHWLIEDTTWEIGGESAGCTLIQRDLSTIELEQAVRRDSAFSTIERFYTDGNPGGMLHPLDMLPRAAGAAICDFQVKGGLALCLFSEQPGLTRARLEKAADENVIHYTDRPFFSLTEAARPPERKLLVHRQSRVLKRHEWRNLWLDCFTEVRRRIQSVYGFQSEVPQPYVHAHLWDHDLKAYGPGWIEPLRDALPEFHRLGYRHIFTHGVWESVTSDDTPGIEGTICCPYAFRFAEKFGGAAGMKRLVDRAHELGLTIFQWFGFQHAKFAPVWKEHPDWLLREANGDPWDGAYQILWCGRMRSGFGRQLLEQIKQVRSDTGLDGIFWDSYMNLGVTCVDWQAPDKAPQADVIWSLQAELQRCGYLQRSESVTVFGVSAVGMYGFKRDKFRRRLWADTVSQDTAFALLDCSPAFFTEGGALGADKVTPENYFWLAGHRCVPYAEARPWNDPLDPSHQGPRLPGGALAEAYARVNHLYNEALPRMQRLRVTPGGRYTLWMDRENCPSVVWAFRDGTARHRGRVRELESGRTFTAKGRFPIRGGQVYLLDP